MISYDIVDFFLALLPNTASFINLHHNYFEEDA